MLIRKVVIVLSPVRYFVINSNTRIMHIQGYCQQTKDRPVPIRLFDTVQELEAYAGRPLQLCRHCRKAMEKQQ